MKTKNLILTAIAAVALMGSAAQADIKQGQKIYLKKLKAKCGANGAKTAALHSQDEWETLKEEGNLAEALIKACPKAKKVIVNEKFQSKYMDDLYDFFYEYANDSGNVPSCG